MSANRETALNSLHSETNFPARIPSLIDKRKNGMSVSSGFFRAMERKRAFLEIFLKTLLQLVQTWVS
jgi:hypothetical protein